MRTTPVDQRIERLAARQHGAFTRQQAIDAGASQQFLRRRVDSGSWARPMQGIYVLASSPGTWLRQCKIAELSVCDGAIGGLAAAALHGLTDFRPCRPELVLPANARSRHPLATCHRCTGAAITTAHGMRLTTIAQTIVDVAHRTSPWRVERALDDALLGHRLVVDELEERLGYYAATRRAGLPLIRALAEERRADGWVPPASALEALLLDVLARLPSSPQVVRQAAPLPWRSRRPGRVDALLPDHRLIVEADGRRWHARVKDFDRDRWRDNEAAAHGYRVLRFTWVHLHDLPAETIGLMERTITRRAA